MRSVNDVHEHQLYQHFRVILEAILHLGVLLKELFKGLISRSDDSVRDRSCFVGQGGEETADTDGAHVCRGGTEIGGVEPNLAGGQLARASLGHDLVVAASGRGALAFNLHKLELDAVLLGGHGEVHSLRSNLALPGSDDQLIMVTLCLSLVKHVLASGGNGKVVLEYGPIGVSMQKTGQSRILCFSVDSGRLDCESLYRHSRSRRGHGYSNSSIGLAHTVALRFAAGVQATIVLAYRDVCTLDTVTPIAFAVVTEERPITGNRRAGNQTAAGVNVSTRRAIGPLNEGLYGAFDALPGVFGINLIAGTAAAGVGSLIARGQT